MYELTITLLLSIDSDFGLLKLDFLLFSMVVCRERHTCALLFLALEF